MTTVWSPCAVALFFSMLIVRMLAINFAGHASQQPNLSAAAPAAAPAAPGFQLPGTPEAKDEYEVIFQVGNLNDGSNGTIIIHVHPGWAPLGARRFKELLDSHFFENSKFFRVIPGFVAQFGLAADANATGKWVRRFIKDDPPLNIPNSRGRVSFASAGQDTRAVQIFINAANNLGLDAQNCTPFAEVTAGMDVVDKLYAGYGDGAPVGSGPGQRAIEALGNTYLDENFPKLSAIQTVLLPVDASPAPSETWRDTLRRISFILMGVAVVAVGVKALYRTGKLERVIAKLKLRDLLAKLQRSASAHPRAREP
mmetsp:Transcript_65881/g.117079  ORF Transcript_65881/g.117079 Transcript_65881/m.117079 type:complete len:311 (-) Transcript_65881:22-954(-)